VYPCGTPRPLASATPFRPAVTVAGTTVAALGANGSVCVYSTAAATITVDVVGRP
jgi:hypothetical protein